MKKYIFSGVSNLLFFNFVIFILTAVFTASAFAYPVNLVFSGFVTILSVFISTIIFKRKILKRKNTSARQEKISEITYALNFSSKKTGLGAIHGAYLKKDENAKLLSDKIVLSNGDRIFNCFGFNGITKKDVVKNFNLSSGGTCVIACDYATKEVKDFASLFRDKVKILEKQDLFKEINPFDINISTVIPIDFSKKPKPNLKLILKRKSAKRFLALGVFFTLMSFFVPIKTYYLVSGAIFIIFSLVLFFFGK